MEHVRAGTGGEERGYGSGLKSPKTRFISTQYIQALNIGNYSHILRTEPGKRMAQRSRGRRATAGKLGLLEEEKGSGRKGRQKLPSDGAIVGRLLRRMFGILFRIVLTFFAGSIALVVIYRFVDPPLTPLMIIRPIEGIGGGKLVGVSKEWIDIDEVDRDLLKSVIAAEDARFFEHGGIDWKAVEAARKYNEKHKGEKVRGASTITMQCARNVFLWQDRNYLRKALEAYFTYLIEFVWGKERILEVYVNAIEWGDGTYGVEAAAQRYFNTSARKLTPRQAALLVAVLPNPRKWSPAEPTGYINKRASTITSRARAVKLDALAATEEKEGKK